MVGPCRNTGNGTGPARLSALAGATSGPCRTVRIVSGRYCHVNSFARQGPSGASVGAEAPCTDRGDEPTRPLPARRRADLAGMDLNGPTGSTPTTSCRRSSAPQVTLRFRQAIADAGDGDRPEQGELPASVGAHAPLRSIRRGVDTSRAEPTSPHRASTWACSARRVTSWPRRSHALALDGHQVQLAVTRRSWVLPTNAPARRTWPAPATAPLVRAKSSR